MLHIIVFLLKIIGILLLLILGLVLLLAVVTLFVPIRYQVAIRHGEDLFFLKGRVNWLLHILHVSLSHDEGIWHIRARVFGFVIFDNLRPRKPDKPKAAKMTGKKKKQKKPVQKPAQMPAVREQRKNEPDSMDLPVSKEQEKSTVTAGDTSAEVSDIREEIIQDRAKPAAVQKIKETGQDTGAAGGPEYEEAAEKGSLFKKISVFKKISDRIRRICEKITNTVREWKRRIKSAFATISSAKNKVNLVMDFIRNELNREGFHVTWVSMKKLFKHILPKKLKSKLVFGTGDPCSTGQALGAMSIFYSFYGDRIQITPDFERSRLEGEHFARGRIRLVTILIIVVRLLFDKRFKKLKKNFIILKEAL